MPWLHRLGCAAALLAVMLVRPCAAQQPTERLYLSGHGADDAVPWSFKVTGGRRAGEWTTIPVPSQWELEGFGTYNYGHDANKADEQGHYRRRFSVPSAWEGKVVRLVFEGVMTDAAVRVNGTSVGAPHRGAFYRFEYDVSALLHYGASNRLAVTVSKQSADASVNRAERQADYWVFGGIFRPVYLEAYPPQHIRRVAIDARADGTLWMQAYLGESENAPHPDRVVAQVETVGGEPVGVPFSAPVAASDTVAVLQTRIVDPKTWTPEYPNRYRVVVHLQAEGRTLHTIRETFGFRTVEVRPHDGLYVNGQKVRLKGVNRHAFWPTTGRTTSRAISEMDVQIMKDMNMNAVRMSHYPPDKHFLEVCDSLGLFVIDELAGWQDAYDTDVGETLVREMVTRDVNHPSIILWANGNEGGWNDALDDDFARYDPQGRAVIHPWATHGGINTAHYRDYGCCAGTFFHGNDVFMPTEFLHGLYDGGHGAGLADWWTLMQANPRSAGGFLWALLDEAVLRTDWQRASGDTLDTDGNHAPDGIVGPYRRAKEGSYYAIKAIWSPVQVRESAMDRLPPSFDGTLHLENQYHFTNLSQVAFTWTLADAPGPASADTGFVVQVRGTPRSPEAAPGQQAALRLELPSNWRAHDILRLTATDPHGRTLYTWSWMLPAPSQLRRQIVHTDVPGGAAVSGRMAGSTLDLRAGELRVQIDTTTGRLVDVQRGADGFALHNGPRLVVDADSLATLEHHAEAGTYVVTATYDGPLEQVRWQLYPSGWLRLGYRFRLSGAYDNVGVTFDYPEDQVTGVKWLGRGPYRVWKNRQRGMRFAVWQKAYNDTRTGIEWDVPAFKGYHANLYWAQLQTPTRPITIVTDTEGLFLRLFTPRMGPDPRHTRVGFPPGDLSFLQGIAPIGTKFRSAARTGPSGQPNFVDGRDAYTGTLYFYFGADLPSRPAVN